MLGVVGILILEMKHLYVRDLGKGVPVPGTKKTSNHQASSGLCSKHDCRHKARLVADGHQMQRDEVTGEPLAMLLTQLSVIAHLLRQI